MSIATLTQPTHISYSQIRSYCQCPQQWYLSRHEEPEFVPVPLKFGAAIHSALDTFYKTVKAGGMLQSSTLIQRFLAAWKRDRDRLPVLYGKRDDEDSTLALGKAMLEAFHAARQASLPEQVIGVEESFELEIQDLHADVPLILRGRIDLIEIRRGRIMIVDHKTAKSAPGEYADLDQLAIYTAAARELDLPADLSVRARFDVITKTKAPELKELPVWIPQQLVRVTLDKVRAIHHAMNAGIVYAVRGWYCASCQWKRHCPAEVC